MSDIAALIQQLNRKDIVEDEREFQIALARVRAISTQKRDEISAKRGELRDLKKTINLALESSKEKLELREDNFRKLWGLDPLYSSEISKQIYQNIESQDDYNIATLTKNKAYLKSKSDELSKLNQRFIKQQKELDLAIASDPDYFSPAEFKGFMSKYSNVGPDGIAGTADDLKPEDKGYTDPNLVAGYQKAWIDYTQKQQGADIRNMINLENLKSKDTSMNKANLKLGGYLERAKKTSFYNIIDGITVNLANNPIDDDSTQEAKDEYARNVATRDSYKIQLGIDYLNLFSNNKVKKENDLLKYGQKEAAREIDKANQAYYDYDNILRIAEPVYETGVGLKAAPDYSAYFVKVKESYSYYITLNAEEKKIHDQIGGRIFGYEPSLMTFGEFAQDFKSQYSKYTLNAVDFPDAQGSMNLDIEYNEQDQELIELFEDDEG
tara:strand:- start:1556 stop:2869 length:1314 start_codon:yes stop_codon:yes gene_type:complete